MQRHACAKVYISSYKNQTTWRAGRGRPGHEFLSLAVSGIPLVLLAIPAQAAPVLTNGSFETTIGRTNPPFPVDNINISTGMLQTSANFTGPATSALTFPEWRAVTDGIGCVVFPGTYGNGVCGSPPARFGGSGFQSGGPGPSPDGGNFVLIDGDPTITTTIYQTVTGLVVGQSYVVTFNQASAQFLDRTGATTEQWDVSLGGDPNPPIATQDISGGVHQLSDLMSTPSQGFHPWESQSLTFQVTDPSLNDGDITSQVLGFFAVGAPGGEPPIVLLDGVSMGPSIPEPSTLVLMSVGLLGIVLASRRKSEYRKWIRRADAEDRQSLVTPMTHAA